MGMVKYVIFAMSVGGKCEIHRVCTDYGDHDREECVHHISDAAEYFEELLR